MTWTEWIFPVVFVAVGFSWVWFVGEKIREDLDSESA